MTPIWYKMYDDLSDTAPRLVPRRGKMYFQRPGLPALSLKNRFCMGHTLKPLLTKQVQTRCGWLSVFLSFYGPQKRNTDLGPNIQTVGHHRIFLPTQPSPYATSTLNGIIITYKSNCSSNRGNKLFLIVSVFLTSFPKKSSGNSLNVTYGSHNPENQLTTTILQWPVHTTEEAICIQLFEITVVKFRCKILNSTMKHDKGKQFWSFISLV